MIRIKPRVLVLGLLVLGLGMEIRLPGGTTTPAARPAARPAGPTTAQEAYGTLPLSFEANQGQAAANVAYLARGPQASFYFTPDAVVVQVGQPTAETGGGHTAAPLPPRVLRMEWEGATSARVAAEHPLAGRVHYLLGDEPAGWHTDIPTYQALSYTGLYRGVSLRYDGQRGGALKSTYTLAPGADPAQIRWHYAGADGLRLDDDGALVVTAGAGTLREAAPLAWQDGPAGRESVAVRYTLGAGDQVGLAVGAYDPARPLILDPLTVVYATFLGGSGNEQPNGIAVDSSGAAYIAGYTNSTNFPTANPYQGSFGGSYDGFIAKLSPAGDSLVYATYFGGSGQDGVIGLAVNSAGAAYVSGWTAGGNFPLVNAYQSIYGGGVEDGFVAQFSPAGNSLTYSTYLGGSDADIARSVTVDGSGAMYVGGLTASTNFPTLNPIQGTYLGLNDAFVTKLNATGSALVYSTYLGGTGTDAVERVAVDGSGALYLGGDTNSSNFPTMNPIQAVRGGSNDAVVAKINPAGSALVYSTYLGGSGYDMPFDFTIDSTGAALIVGDTDSPNFPTANAYQGSYHGTPYDGFVTKINPAGNAYVFSTYLGTIDDDRVFAVAADSSNAVYVAGSTGSPSFPLVSPVQATFGGGTTDMFISKFDPAGSTLLYSTYLGASGNEYGEGLAVDGNDSAYVLGPTTSFDFPLINPIQGVSGGGADAVVAKLDFPRPTATATAVPPTQTPGGPTATNTPTPTITLTPTSTGTATSTPTATNTPCAVITPVVETFELGLGSFTTSWTTCQPGGCGWVTNAPGHTGNAAAFAPDLAGITDQRLELSAPISIPYEANSVVLTFWHQYSFETPDYDGGVLEVSTDGGSNWADVGLASFQGGGYNAPINNNYQNPLGGRPGWVGTTGGVFRPVTVTLNSLIGQDTVKFRFRLGTDTVGAGGGWRIDDVRLTVTTFTACGAPTRTPTSTASPTNTATATPTPAPVACAPIALAGSLTNSDPTKHSTGSTFGSCVVAACPGDTDSGFHYDAYIFQNPSASPQCITVNLDSSSCGASTLWISAYLGSFDPNNACSNFLIAHQAGGDVTFNVPAGQSFWITIEEYVQNQGCPSYTGTIQAANLCPTGTPTSTPTPGPPTATGTATRTQTVGPTSTATLTPVGPTSTATRTQVGPTSTATATRTPVTPTPSPVCEGWFGDVAPTDYFFEPVRYLACHGVIGGYSDGTFRPYNQTTRGQMSKIVVLAFALPTQTPAGGGYSFTDNPPGSTFYAYIETAAAAGIVGGYPCGGVNPQTGAAEPCDGASRPYYRPGNNVTRGQLSKIIVQAAVGARGWTLQSPATASFTDVPVGSTFFTYVETAVCHSILGGYSDGTFRPSANATRGQIAKIAYYAVGSGATCGPAATPRPLVRGRGR